MKPVFTAVALTVVAFGAVGAQSNSFLGPRRQSPIQILSALKSSYQARSVLSVAAGSPNDPTFATPKGGAYDGVAALFIERTDIPVGFGALCTGALLFSNVDILTAAHCLADVNGQITATKATVVFFPPNQPATFREIVFGSQFFVNPAYTGEVIDAHDVGMIRLDAAPSSGITRYGLAPGNQAGENFNVAGSGTVGTGAGGYTGGGGFTLADRHQGNNTYDFSFTDPGWGGFWDGFFGFADPNVLISDFDDGTSAHDTSCILSFLITLGPQFCHTGLGGSEVQLGPGDSGGPAFINGRIASINSFILSFGSNFGDTDNLLNGTFGEMSGYTSVDANRAWILATAVPEPGTVVLVVTGLVGIFAARRRRKA